MLQEGVLFRSKQFIPDHRYNLNFIDMWSVDEVVVIDISRDVTFKDKEKHYFFEQLLNISKNAYVPITAGGGIHYQILKNYLNMVQKNFIKFCCT